MKTKNLTHVMIHRLQAPVLLPRCAVAVEPDDLTAMSPLEIPGLRDIAVKEYGEWQVSHVCNDILETAFRHVCDVMLEHGQAEQVYKDQDANFFIEKEEK